MVVSVIHNNSEAPVDGVSYVKLIVDVLFIFIMGLFLLIIFKTFSQNKIYFTVSLATYLIIISMYTLLYMNMVKSKALLNSIHHRSISFSSIYNVFLSIFLIVVSMYYM